MAERRAWFSPSRQDLKIELLEETVSKLQQQVEELKEERYERKDPASS